MNICVQVAAIFGSNTTCMCTLACPLHVTVHKASENMNNIGYSTKSYKANFLQVGYTLAYINEYIFPKHLVYVSESLTTPRGRAREPAGSLAGESSRIDCGQNMPISNRIR